MSGSMPAVAGGSSSRCWARSVAIRTVALTRSAKRRQSKPRLLRMLGALGQTRDRFLMSGEFRRRRLHQRGRFVVFATKRRLGGADPGELVAPRQQVVGGQPQPGVTQVGLDRLGAAGHLGLAPERLELAPQLGGEVVEPGQVRRHRLELAYRLLLALAVLEHAGGFLDERAAVLRSGLQDLRQLALADDHVHLAADARIAQQLLDVHQTARVAVDFVFAGAVPVHPASDRHLGVLDRQRVVGVVDGDGHLGAAQRRAARGAGEDDVLHLAAAQRLGPLLAHDPTQRVDDIALARSVGADDAGDTRLEAQSRRRGEGLEALQRQTLEVHEV